MLSVEVKVNGIIFIIHFLLLASRQLTNFCMLIVYIAILMKIFFMIFFEIFSIFEVEMLFFSFGNSVYM